MDDNNQPFTDYATNSNRRSARWGWPVAAVLAVALVVTLLLWATTVGKMRGLESLQGKLDNANASLAAALDTNQTNKDLIAALQSKITELQNQQEASAQMSNSANRCRATAETFAL